LRYERVVGEPTRTVGVLGDVLVLIRGLGVGSLLVEESVVMLSFESGTIKDGELLGRGRLGVDADGLPLPGDGGVFPCWGMMCAHAGRLMFMMRRFERYAGERT
jgi:hypothetical protein